MPRWASCLLCLALGLLLLLPANAHAEPALFPWPATHVSRPGAATISVGSEVRTQAEPLRMLAAQLAVDLRRLAGASKATVPGVPIDLALLASPDHAALGREGYVLQISAQQVLVQARDVAGVFYGTRTLLQMLQPGQNVWRVRTSRIVDKPRFSFRGMHLDVARHFFSVAEIESYLDLLAAYKLNVFHWHLTDDQGWRIEIPTRPRLTTIAGFREDRRHERFALAAELRAAVPAGTPRYGGYYNADDIKRVVAYAAARHITVIPELDWPGHSQAAMAAYPELSCVTGKPYQVAPGAVYPFSDPLCPCKPQTMEFVRDVLDVVLALFPGPWVHIGGDEVNTSTWKTPACDAFRKSQNLPDEAALQRHFIEQVALLVRQRGRTPVVWQEAAEHGPPPAGSLTIVWKNGAMVAPLASAGVDVVSADSSVFYMDVRNGDAGAGYAGFHRVRTHEPMPPGLAEDQQEHLLGVQGTLWTEFVQTYAQVQTAVLPRLAALSEVAWTPPAGRKRADASVRLRAHLTWLAQQGHHVFVPPPTGIPARVVFLQQTWVQPRSPERGFVVRYSTNGQDPSASSPIAPRRLLIKATTTLKARSYLAGTSIASDVSTSVLVRGVPAQPRTPKTQAPGVVWTLHPGRAVDARHASATPGTKRGILDIASVPNELRGQDAFGLTLEGFVAVAGTGVHTFCTTSNDGSVLFINEEAVVENDLIHSARTRCGQVALAAGTHAFKLLYFEDYHAEILSVAHGFGGRKPQELPAAAFTHAP